METILQTNFGGGELAPEFWNDKLLKQYPISLKTLRNFKVDRAGKLKKFPGTVVVPNSGGSENPRLIPFVTGPQSGYVLLFYEGSIAFVQSGKLLLAAQLAWSSSTYYIQGQTVSYSGSVYVCLASNINNTPPGFYWLSLGTISSNPTYSITSPFAISDVQGIKYRQVNGALYLVHPNYPPQIITLTTIGGNAVFACNPIPFVPSQSSLANNMGATATGGTTYTAKYLITTVNATNGNESFPGIVGSTGSAKTISTVSTVGTTPPNHFGFRSNIVQIVTTTANSFSVGENIYFSGIIFTSGTNFNGQTAPIKSIVNSTTFLIYVGQDFAGNPNTGTGGSAAPPSGPTISAISFSNPCEITLSGSFSGYTMATGDIMTIIGTGIPQLDGNPFIVSVIDSTHVYLIGVDSTNFPVPASTTGAIFPNIIKVSTGTITQSNPVALAWNAPSSFNNTSLVYYNIYRNDGAGFGFIASTYASSYSDVGTPPDLNFDPPSYTSIFNTTGNYPSCIEVYQQRLMLGSTKNNPLELDASRTGETSNFTDHQSGLQANDAIVQQTLQTEAASVMQDMIDFGFLIVFTDQHELVLAGDSTGTLTPEAVNSRRQMFNGASPLRPLKANKSVIFVQANTSIIRDLQVEITPYGFTYLAKSNELTLYSNHLVQGYSINDWDYKKIYDSEIWATRSDGQIIGTPYNIEQGIDAAWWHRDTQGSFKNICCVPEGLEVAVYVTCQRQAANPGHGKLYFIERFSSENWSTIQSANYLDAATIVDGRSSTLFPGGTNGMTLSLTTGSTLWDGTQNLTLTADSSFFTNAMVGDWIYLESQSVFSNGILVTTGKEVKFQITGYTSGTVVTGTVEGTVPDGVTALGTDGTIYTNMRNVNLLVWGHAVTEVTSIPIGGPVAVVGDGMVQSNPYNLQQGQSILTPDINGNLAIPQPAVVAIVGLPYFSDIELLDFDNGTQDSLINKKSHVKQAVCMVTSTQGFWAGSRNPDTNPQAPQNIPGPVQTPNYTYGLTEAKIRKSAGYDSSVDLANGRVFVDIAGDWDYGSRLFIRSPDPIPCNFSAIGVATELPSVGK